jgi:hypothetical protein
MWDIVVSSTTRWARRRMYATWLNLVGNSLRFGTIMFRGARSAWLLGFAVAVSVISVPGVARAGGSAGTTMVHPGLIGLTSQGAGAEQHFEVFGKARVLVSSGRRGSASLKRIGRRHTGGPVPNAEKRCTTSHDPQKFSGYTKGPGMAFMRRSAACAPAPAQSAGPVPVGLLYALCTLLLLIPALLRWSASPPGSSDSDSDDGWGKGPPEPPVPPKGPWGGVPLPDAEPAGVRFRGPDRLADRPVRDRRPAREPRRRPVRTRRARW